jgi:hypothetical protein
MSMQTALRGVRQVTAYAALAWLAAGPLHAAPTPPANEAATDAFWRGDFGALEQQNALYRQPGSFDTNGGSQLSQMRMGLDRVTDNKTANAEAYLSEVDRLTLQWAQAQPQSALAHILHARALSAHGWSYRGNGLADEVPAQAMRDFIAYQQRAVKYLQLHADVALNDSYAHYTLIAIGKTLNWDRKALQAIAQQGLAVNPQDIDIPVEIVASLLPKWGGDARSLDVYIRQASAQSRAFLGTGLYALLYSAAAKNQYQHALFQDSHANWDLVKQGYDDFLQRYPASNAKRNRYAWMACMAKDRATLLALLGQLGTNIDLAEWGANPERGLEACRKWATQL